MRYTLGEAAKATGKSKTTIQRAVSKGLISASKEKSGRYSIDPSELHRVFPVIPSETISQPSQVDNSRPQIETPLQMKVQALEAMLEREREALTEMRSDRDAWKQQATALLGAPERKRRSWWPFR
jgi:predicted site-specific integrase-resolvase